MNDPRNPRSPRLDRTPRDPRLERAALVGLISRGFGKVDPDHALDELAGLAQAAGGEVVLQVLQDRPKPDPATFLGSGKVDALAAACAETGVAVVIFDNELTPAQLRNLEARLGRKVVDRTQLILDIFARRARAREGKLQVELAQLKYLMPRLVGAGAALSRLGGGIGTRGPGETKLEVDRRRIRHRISALGREIDAVRRRRAQLRERRHKAAVPTVALVGYTNAGKTTVFNALTGGGAPTSDALFVTLDPLVRRLSLPDGRQLLVSDTVGFIDRLPHSLIAAFRATLEEVAEADLLVHVIDAASPDRSRHADAVRQVLAEVGAATVPMLEVFNKCDLLDAGDRGTAASGPSDRGKGAPGSSNRGGGVHGSSDVRRLQASNPASLCISALRGDGRQELVEAITSRLSLDTARVTLEFDAASDRDRARIAQLYRQARVLRHVTMNGKVSVEAEVPRRLLPVLGVLTGAAGA